MSQHQKPKSYCEWLIHKLRLIGLALQQFVRQHKLLVRSLRLLPPAISKDLIKTAEMVGR